MDVPKISPPSPKDIPENLGLPPWAWPVLGLTAGLLLLVVVHGTCFVDPNCG